jgi:hypothetical protein
VVVRAPAGGRVPVTVFLGRYVPAVVGPVEVVAELDGRVLGRAVIEGPASQLDRRRTVALRFMVDVPAGEPVRVDLRCRSWVPAEVGIGTDTRPHGVAVIGCTPAAAGGAGWRAALRPVRADRAPRHLDSYDRVLANSLHPGLDRAAVAPAQRRALPAGDAGGAGGEGPG